MDTRLGRWSLLLEGDEIPDKALIGGKAYSLATMQALGLTVPPAFVITTEACRRYLETGDLPEGLAKEVEKGLVHLEKATGRNFAKGPSPLLVSVRSGAAISMPGMMDTILNLGINEESEDALAQETGDPAFARDTHRRFHEMYAKTVLGAPIGQLAAQESPESWKHVVEEVSGATIPEDPKVQLMAAITAVFESWNARRAKRYRKHHGIGDKHGTAALVPAMVFGTLDERSGTGVLFSRNPLDGHAEPYGEFLARAQGEDVVSGERTPEPVARMQEQLPEAFDTLIHAASVLERHHRDVQDIEFTVQRGELFLLQSRAAKRSPKAAVRFAVDLAEEGILDKDTALARVSSDQVRMMLRPRLKDTEAADRAAVMAEGEPACQGIGVGTVVSNPDEANTRAERGESIILARRTTSPEDVHAMTHAKGVITELGGSTSHAAVISRALGVPCVVGCGEETVTGLIGKTVTVDGDSGRVYAEALPVEAPREADDPRLRTLIEWARERSPIQVVPPDTLKAADVIDLDHSAGGEDVARYPEVLKGYTAAKGGLIATDEGVQCALAAGLQTIGAEPVLPPLLAAAHHISDEKEPV